VKQIGFAEMLVTTRWRTLQKYYLAFHKTSSGNCRYLLKIPETTIVSLPIFILHFLLHHSLFSSSS